MSILGLTYLFFNPFVLADDGMSKKALRIIQDDYLWDYSPQEALYSAAEGAEDAIPWLIVERTEEGGFIESTRVELFNG